MFAYSAFSEGRVAPFRGSRALGRDIPYVRYPRQVRRGCYGVPWGLGPGPSSQQESRVAVLGGGDEGRPTLR